MMVDLVELVIFRYLTHADFFNLYKPPGSEQGGGGQSYVDFPTSKVTVDEWAEFFHDAEQLTTETVTQGPAWTTRVRSIGLPENLPAQTIRVYRRRHASVSISNQYLFSAGENRVKAWHPQYGFPEPRDSSDRHQLPTGLAVYLARTATGEIWAGWFQRSADAPLPVGDPAAREILAQMLAPQAAAAGTAGRVDTRGAGLVLDRRNHAAPFRSPATGSYAATATPSAPSTAKTGSGATLRAIEEEAIQARLLAEDQQAEPTAAATYNTVSVRQRNQRAVQALKSLYGCCQMTGKQFVFVKRDGQVYMEGHHLVPLGAGGADDPRNIVVVSPLIHRMLHYARIDGLNLDHIVTQPDGSAKLSFQINGSTYVISWHPVHAKLVAANAG